MRTQTEKAVVFRDLHERPGAFIISICGKRARRGCWHQWDLRRFATTSRGLANMLGRADSTVSRADVIGLAA